MARDVQHQKSFPQLKQFYSLTEKILYNYTIVSLYLRTRL